MKLISEAIVWVTQKKRSEDNNSNNKRNIKSTKIIKLIITLIKRTEIIVMTSSLYINYDKH